MGVGGEKATLTCRLKFYSKLSVRVLGYMYFPVSMVILAAKSTDTHFEEVRRRFSAGWGQSGLAVVQVGFGSYVCSEGPSLLSLTLQ